MQEIILKCLEVDPARRYLNAGGLLADLNHPGQIRLTERSIRKDDSGFLSALKSLFRRRQNITSRILAGSNPTSAGPSVVLAAVDLADSMDPLAEEVRLEVARALLSRPGSKLACVTILKTKLIGEDKVADSGGGSLYIGRLVDLKQ